MIITRTPFRITLGGGGTDLPSFYRQQGGFVFAMCINQFMNIMLNPRTVVDRRILIRYSQVETVSRVEDILHPLAREGLRLHGIHDNIELTSIADMPAKAGLGSSGAYMVGLLAAIRAYKRESASQQDLAEEACRIEMDILKEPVGKQDQYMAAFGGFRTLDIDKDGRVTVGTVPVDSTTMHELVLKAPIYYTGVQRSATSILKEQDRAARENGSADHARVMESLCQIKALGYRIRDAFVQQDLDTFGRLMDEHWQHKKQMSPTINLSVLDDLYAHVKKHYGVLGGKLIGAGGGGFLMLYCPKAGRELSAFMAGHDMPHVNYFPVQQGARVVSDLTETDNYDA